MEIAHEQSLIYAEQLNDEIAERKRALLSLEALQYSGHPVDQNVHDESCQRPSAACSEDRSGNGHNRW